MSFLDVTAAQLAGQPYPGTPLSGVAAMFPKFQFDTTSKLVTRTQLEEICADALSIVRRLVRARGYDPGLIVDADDIRYTTRLAVLTAASVVDQRFDSNKEAKSPNEPETQLGIALKEFSALDEPFPSVERTLGSAPRLRFPDRMVRGWPDRSEPEEASIHVGPDEVPQGAVNGANTTYSLSYPPATTTVLLLKDGVPQLAPSQYTLSGNTLTFVTAPAPGSVLIVKGYAYLV